MIIASQDTRNNPALFTPWSIVHFLSGVVAKLLNVDFRIFLFLNILYESKDLFFSSEENSWQNSIADVLSGILGYYTSSKIILGITTVIIVLLEKQLIQEI